MTENDKTKCELKKPCVEICAVIAGLLLVAAVIGGWIYSCISGTSNECNFSDVALVLTVAIFGFLSLMVVINHMDKGFGPYNTRITGVVIIATFTAILAVLSEKYMNGLVGIFGAIVGYLFGSGAPVRKKPVKKKMARRLG